MASGKAGWSRIALSIALALAFGATFVAPVFAENSMFTEEYDRTGIAYMHLLYQFNNQGVAPRFTTESGEVIISMDDLNLWGIGFGYFFTDKIGLRFETMMGSTDMRGTGAQTGVVRDAFVNTGVFSVDFLPLARRFTPFLTGGIGWHYVEATLYNLPPEPGYCYWDPWWGYICTGASYPSVSNTQFLWNVGVGFRWDAPSNFFLQSAIEVQWYKFDGAENYERDGKVGISLGVAY